MKNIVEIAAGNDQFKTLVAAVTSAGLAETLKGPGPFTVFAPTDDAFAKLHAGTVEGLLKNLPKLKNILTYHVVPGKVLAKDVVGLKTAKTAQGGDIRVDASHGVMINNAKVTLADLLLMFIYLEVLTMVGYYLASGRLPVRIPLYIGMVALARYLVLDIKALDTWHVVAISASVLLFACATLVLRYGESHFSDEQDVGARRDVDY